MRSISGRAWAWLGTNAIFGACHPGLAPALPELARTLAVNAVLFALPAAGWSWIFGSASRAPGMRLARSVAISTGALVVLLIFLRIARVIPTQTIAWNAMWLLTNAGFVVAALAAPKTVTRRSLTLREAALGGALFLGSYALYFHGATRIVPPMVDHDLEVQATGYGLITRFEPLLLTDRHTVYFFAHPPLLHVYTAASFLYQGAFSDLAFFDEVSRRVRDRGEAAKAEAEIALIYQRYLERPHLIETRTPSLFFASATVALLGLWAGRISRRWWIGLLAAAAYASNPEVFVRSSYGGYFAIGGLAAIIMLLAAERWQRWPDWRHAGLPILAGAGAALSDHKLILLPAAMAVSALTASRRLLNALPPVVVGFGLGTTVFWLFGLALAPAEFLQDHVFSHVIDRVTHNNRLGYFGFPGPLGLWREFVAHTGYVLLPIGLLLMIADVRSRRSRGDRAPLRSLWLAWALVTGVVFSIVDWRMTKHLAPLILALHLGLIPNRDAPRWRVLVPTVTLLFLLAWNANIVGSLMRDFAAFTVTPDW